MTPRDRFFEFITAERLYLVAGIFCTITAITVALIYIYLYQKKRRFFARKKIADKLDEWIGYALLEEGDIEHTYVDAELLTALEDHANRQYITDLLISTKKNITGQAARNISRIYEQLGLQEDSLKKFRSRQWHLKAKGIYELYMMDQRHMQDEIFRYTNSSDEFIRTEAQTAVISFQGFEGLKFLNTLEYPLTEWQQLKILEQLKALDPQDMTDLHQWLLSTNEYVVLLALRLAEIYYQLHIHDDILRCLESPNHKIRNQAIVTLARLANTSTADILKARYDKETPANKRQILQQLARIGDGEDAAFFKKELDNADDLLKLESARALVRTDPDGLMVLGEKANTGEVYLQIYKHVKQEMA